MRDNNEKVNSEISSFKLNGVSTIQEKQQLKRQQSIVNKIKRILDKAFYSITDEFLHFTKCSKR